MRCGCEPGYWGDDGENEVILEQGDVISIPTGVMRGFRNAGSEYAILIGIIEGSNPPGVVWHDSVIEAARDTGLELDEEGKIS